jgi:predicted GNAT family N-acyltransferase
VSIGILIRIQSCHLLQEERDGLDPDCDIVLAVDNNHQPIGTARLLPSGKIGRMAVLKAWRGQGIGSAMLQELLAIAAENKLNSVYLHGQIQAIAFYEAHGFIPEGPVFEEAGIAHRIMRLKITSH